MTIKLLQQWAECMRKVCNYLHLVSFALILSGLLTSYANAETTPPPRPRAQIIGENGQVLSEVADLFLPQAMRHCHCSSMYRVVGRAMFSKKRRLYFSDGYSASPQTCPHTLTVSGIYSNGLSRRGAPLPVSGNLELHKDGTYSGLIESMNKTPYFAVQVWNIRLNDSEKCPR